MMGKINLAMLLESALSWDFKTSFPCTSLTLLHQVTELDLDQTRCPISDMSLGQKVHLLTECPFDQPITSPESCSFAFDSISK